MAAQGLLNPNSGIFNTWYWVKLVVLGLIVGYLSTVVAKGSKGSLKQSLTDYMSSADKINMFNK